MAKLQYKDNAASLLTATIADTDTPATLSITSGTGAKFPSLTAGQWFPVVVIKVSTLAYEEMRVTARSSDSMTATREQGGSTALNFDIGDVVYLGSTKSFLDEFLLTEDAQGGKPHWLGTAGGTADALTAGATPAITAYAAGQLFTLKASSANTTGVTIDIDSVGVKSVLDAHGNTLIAGALAANGIYCLQYDGTAFRLPNYVQPTAVPNLASGDRLIFQQTTPSASFVKDTAITSNSALRLITGTVVNDLTGSAFTTIFASRTSGNQNANHGHPVTAAGTVNNHTTSATAGAGGGVFTYNTSSLTHTFTGSSVTSGIENTNHQHVTDFKVDYYDAVIGEAA